MENKIERSEEIQKMLPSPRKFSVLVQKAINEEPLAGSITDFDSYCDYRLTILVCVASEIFYGRFEQAHLAWFINGEGNVNHHVIDYAVEEVEQAIESNDALWTILCDVICNDLQKELKQALGRNKWQARYDEIFAGADTITQPTTIQ